MSAQDIAITLLCLGVLAADFSNVVRCEKTSSKAEDCKVKSCEPEMAFNSSEALFPKKRSVAVTQEQSELKLNSDNLEAYDYNEHDGDNDTLDYQYDDGGDVEHFAGESEEGADYPDTTTETTADYYDDITAEEPQTTTDRIANDTDFSDHFEEVVTTAQNDENFEVERTTIEVEVEEEGEGASDVLLTTLQTEEIETIGPFKTESKGTKSPLDSENATAVAERFFVRIVLKADFEKTVTDKDKFSEELKVEVAEVLKISVDNIAKLEVKAGSVVAEFEVVADENLTAATIKENAKLFLEQVKEDKVKLGDKKLSVVSASFGGVEVKNEKATSHSVHHGGDNAYLILGLSIGAIIVMVLLVVITACVVRAYMFRKYQRQIYPSSAIVYTQNVRALFLKY